jgi:NAD(P)-dependent dehydrogenase (short-subunit alcohol dehydrogenase family)
MASKDLPPLESLGKVFWTNQFRTTIEMPDPKTYPDLHGKSAIVTGGNSGLGFEASRQLLSLGLSRLVIAVRTIEKGNMAATKLKKQNPTAQIDVWHLDMESYSSIQSFVRQCSEDLPNIDYTILNAGVSPISFHKSKLTGHEVAVQVNHISTALMILLLLPILRATATDGNPARLTIVNSVTAHFCKFPNRNLEPLLTSFDDAELVPWDPQERYGVSKLLSQAFVTKLCDGVDSDRVVINMVDPGLTKGTALSRDAHGMLRLASRVFFGVAGRPVGRGAATYLHALLIADRESHGCFLMNNRIAP